MNVQRNVQRFATVFGIVFRAPDPRHRDCLHPACADA